MSEFDNKAEDKVFEEDNGDDCDDDCQYIFPQRLMSILADERNSDAICWLPHGRAFIIRNRKVFAEKVMPRFFPRKSKYSSFTRKLNRWNFVRVSSGPELGAYYHEFFLRDKPHLAAQMFCKNARTKIAMASSEPKPTPPAPAASQNAVESQPPAQSPQPLRSTADQAQLYLMGQHNIDPSMQLLLEQQLGLCNSQQLNTQNNVMGMNSMLGGPLANMNLFQNAGSTSLALQQKIEAQKQQQARMIQLQQLMALNLQRQQKRKSNNPRASAA
mmetsp:Transcript_34818/g.54340  ORF Transcript_34818/g.54340 Transcript_34818/m.54340 type:complete len:272 (-) Transcript_34818:128-943(-)